MHKHLTVTVLMRAECEIAGRLNEDPTCFSHFPHFGSRLS